MKTSIIFDSHHALPLRPSGPLGHPPSGPEIPKAARRGADPGVGLGLGLGLSVGLGLGLGLSLLLLGACGAAEDPSVPECAAALCTVEDRDPEVEGSRTTVVHAPESEAAVVLRFQAPEAAVSPDDVAAGAWDLSFARTTIRSNGGASGPGAVEVAWRDGLTLADAGEPPSDGWVSDGADEDTLAFAADGGWYRYDVLRHVVEPRDRVYYVKTSDGAVIALEMISYYDHRGESRYPTLNWDVLVPPADPADPADPAG